jgi:hypothetical protein
VSNADTKADVARDDHVVVPSLSSSSQIGHFIKWERAKRRTALLHEAGYLLLGLVSLATVTGLYFWLDAPLVAAAFTYLVILVLLSLVSNFSSLIVLSFIGVGCLNFFRSSDLQLPRRLPTRPHHNIRVCDHRIRRQLSGDESSGRTT